MGVLRGGRENNKTPPPAAPDHRRGGHRGHIPYIYFGDEILQLMEAAAALGSPHTIYPLTYSTLFGLLAATGIRISEALALRVGDVTEDGLIINHTKFKKSRLVPIHDTTRAAINRYLSARVVILAGVDSLSISKTGGALGYNTVSGLFRRLSRKIGLRGEPGRPGPRIHDLRHTFAVRSLERCPCNDAAVSRHILALITYLGHAHVADTYWCQAKWKTDPLAKLRIDPLGLHERRDR